MTKTEIDWEEIEETYGTYEDYPVLFVIGDIPREYPEECHRWAKEIWSGRTVGTVVEIVDGEPLIKLVPNLWKLQEDGSLKLTYSSDGEFSLTIPSDAYSHIHASNPMNDKIDESVIMERSNLRMTIG